MSPTEDASAEDTEVTAEDAEDTALNADVTADDNDTTEEDPVELAIRAAVELERSRLIDEARAAAEADRRADQQRQRAEEDTKLLRDSWAEATKTARAAAQTLRVKTEDGDVISVTLDDDTIQSQIIAPFERHNAKASLAAQTEVFTTLATAAMESLPESQREEFAKRAAAQPLDKWLEVYREMAAPHTNAIKDRARAEDAKIKAAEARGYTKGQRAPAGTARQGSETSRAGNGSVDLTTQFGLADALSKGLLSESEYIEKRKALF